MGVTQGAGLSLQWFRNRLAPGSEYDDLTAEATLSPEGAQGLFWLPYLMGERTPHLDALARGAWVGLTAKHQRADLIRSVLEGVCYSQKDCLEIIASLGVCPELVLLSGGGAKSPFWHQLFADIFDLRVATQETQEGSAYGAALLALMGTEKVGAVVFPPFSVKQPRMTSAQSYARRYQVYTSLYPALRESFQAIAHLES